MAARVRPATAPNGAVPDEALPDLEAVEVVEPPAPVPSAAPCWPCLAVRVALLAVCLGAVIWAVREARKPAPTDG